MPWQCQIAFYVTNKIFAWIVFVSCNWGKYRYFEKQTVE